MQIRTASVILLIGAALGAGLMYKLRAPQTIEVEKEVVKKDIVTRIIERKSPNGTTETETVITDTSSERRDSTSKITKDERKYTVSALAGINSDLTPAYGVLGQKHFDAIAVGIGFTTRKEVSVTVGLSF